jgi:hypothetical protein
MARDHIPANWYDHSRSEMKLPIDETVCRCLAHGLEIRQHLVTAYSTRVHVDLEE